MKMSERLDILMRRGECLAKLQLHVEPFRHRLHCKTQRRDGWLRLVQGKQRGSEMILRCGSEGSLATACWK